MATPPARTLADQLRGWSGAQLSALLEARPDLGVPAPSDSAQLAARAATRSSIVRALDQLSVAELGVLEAVVNGRPDDAYVEDPAPLLDRLAEQLLIWDDGRGPRALTAIIDIFKLADGPTSEEIPALLAEVDDRARAILDHLDQTGAEGTVDAIPARLTVASAATPTQELLARRLLVARDGRHVTLPWSVRLHLREGRATRTPIGTPPSLALSPVAPDQIDGHAAGAAFELCRRTEVLLDRWGTHPPGALRAGGLGVRELKGAATMLHLETDEAALIIELAHRAGLLAQGMTDELDAAWLPTDAFDAWLAADPAERWVRLATAWLTNPRLVQPADVTGRRANALSEGAERAWLITARREALTELAGVPEGQALASGTGLPSLLARLAWLRPRRSAGVERAVTTALTEAAFIGFTGRDALSRPARTLLAGEDAAPLLAKALPPPVDHVLLQADLTAIAPGPLESELARQLALLAEVESRGGATVYRFTNGSVRRGFDAGWSALEIHDFVATASRTPVPQALSYLIDDVARRFGVIRAGMAESFLRSDDETALTELMHHSEAASLRLRRIAPTVVISDVPLATLLPRLREIGMAPVVEAADGTVRIARADVHRARSPRARPASAQARAGARTAAVVAAVKAGDKARASRPSQAPVTSPADVMALLRSAAEIGASVTIGYVGNDGTVGQRLVRPLRVEGGRLTAHDERSDDQREFAVHRITAATTLTQTPTP